MPNWRCRQKRSIGNVSRILLRKNPTTVINHDQQALLGRAHYGEAVLDPAHDGHATMQPSVQREIPRWHQQQAHTPSPVFATQAWEIHVLEISMPQVPNGYSLTTSCL
jgi:hypothetical protein